MNEELQIIARTLADHHEPRDGQCVCGRIWSTSFAAHQADEVVEALRENGFGVFPYEHLDLDPELLAENL